MGAWLHQLSAGLTASLGALVFLYLPDAHLLARLRSLVMSSAIMLIGYGLGMLSSTDAFLQAPTLMLLTALATLYCRVFVVGGPPGSLFFVIAASIAASVPTFSGDGLNQLLLVGGGCLWAVMVAWLYGVWVSEKLDTQPSTSKGDEFSKLCMDALLIGLVVGASFALAQVLHLEKPYWVLISCLAVIQGGSLREIWNKQLHRMVGTSLGLLVVAIVFNSPPSSDWEVAGWIILLTFVIELTVARHYAAAVAFITPMTILLADAGHAAPSSLWSLAQLRLLDTSMGCFLGVLGGILLYARRADVRPQPSAHLD